MTFQLYHQGTIPCPPLSQLLLQGHLTSCKVLSRRQVPKLDVPQDFSNLPSQKEVSEDSLMYLNPFFQSSGSQREIWCLIRIVIPGRQASYMHTHTCACGGQMLTLIVFLYYSSPCFSISLRQCFSVNLEPMILATLVGLGT